MRLDHAAQLVEVNKRWLNQESTLRLENSKREEEQEEKIRGLLTKIFTLEEMNAELILNQRHKPQE